MNIVVRLATDRSAIVVPTAAVQMGPQGQYVYVVKPDKTVAVQPVAVARTAGNETVIKTGVSAGDIVVTDGHLRLVPGSHISVKTPGAPKVES